MLKKTLILPFAIEDEESLRREDWLSRQLPALLRNALEKDKPGLMTASPLAAENDGRRTWIVHRRRWEPAEAARFASERHYERVVVGQVVGSPSPGGIRQVEVLAVDAQTSEVLADIRLEGDLIQVSRELLERLAFLVDLRPEGAAARLEPGTRSALAFEHYLRGLDVLLTLRSPGIDLERPDGAIEPFEAALACDPDFADALTAGLSCALQTGEAHPADPSAPDLAIRALERWRDRWPEDPRIVAVAAEVLVAQKRPLEALRWLQAGLRRIEPVNRDLLRRSGDLLLDLGQNAEALQAYETCESMQHEAPVKERMANLCVMLARYDEATLHLREMLEEQPERRDLSLRLGLVHERLDRKEAMWGSLTRCFQDHQSLEAVDLVRLNAIVSRHAAAPEFVDRIKTWYPPEDLDSERRLLFAKTLRLSGAVVEAGFCLNSIRPQTLTRDNRVTLAREFLNLEFDDFDQRFAILARAIVDRGEIPDDSDLLTLARQSQSEFWPASFLWGILLGRRGDHESSIAVLDQVLAQQPQNDVIWYTRGIQFENLTRDEEARESFRRAIAINAREPDYHTHLALVQARLHEPGPARESLAEVLRLRPDHPDNDKIRQAIRDLQ